jgi:hypothetical protein
MKVTDFTGAIIKFVFPGAAAIAGCIAGFERGLQGWGPLPGFVVAPLGAMAGAILGAVAMGCFLVIAWLWALYRWLTI